MSDIVFTDIDGTPLWTPSSEPTSASDYGIDNSPSLIRQIQQSTSVSGLAMGAAAAGILGTTDGKSASQSFSDTMANFASGALSIVKIIGWILLFVVVIYIASQLLALKKAL